MSKSPADYPVLQFSTQDAWRDWLHEHHAAARGVWLRFGKAKSTLSTIGYADALDVALCYGWIDGQSKGLDEESWLQKFTPRGRRSVWSKRNREHVERLVASGAMQPAGLAAVNAARANGRWDRAYDAPSTAAVPDDLQAALAANSAAAAAFEALSRSRRFHILYHVQTAVKPETRARRIAKFVGMLERGEAIG